MASVPALPMTRSAVAWLALAAAVALAGVWVLRTFDPNAAGSFFPPCPFLELTGLFCPGCGITRALHALVHFDWARAVSMNALVVLSMPLLGAMALQGVSPRPLLPPAVARVVFDGRGWIVALVVFGVARNLPWFAWLAPGSG